MTIAPFGVPEAQTRACFRSPARLARALGRSATAAFFRCAFHGHERRLRAGHRRRCNPHPCRYKFIRPQTRAEESMMLRECAAGVTLAVRAQPGAKKTAITGVYGEGAAAQLKIAVHAPPLEGRANQALIAYLAELFSLPKNAVEIISGELSRSKVFLLRGVTLENVKKQFPSGCFHLKFHKSSPPIGRKRKLPRAAERSPGMQCSLVDAPRGVLRNPTFQLYTQVQATPAPVPARAVRGSRHGLRQYSTRPSRPIT